MSSANPQPEDSLSSVRMALLIRPMEEQHRGLILCAQSETARISYGRDVTPAEREAIRARFDSAVDDPHSNVYVCYSEDDLLGYFWLETRTPHTVFIMDIFVRHKYRGQGYGSAMLHEVVSIALAMRARKIKLAVAEINSRAIDFYVSHGFNISAAEQRDAIQWYELVKPTSSGKGTRCSVRPD